MELVSEGSVKGLITKEPKGIGGFGYDPVFYVPEMMKTFAEMTIEEMRARVNEPDQTLSGKFLNQILDNKYEVEEFAEQISKKYHQHYLNSEIKNAENSNMIHQEVSSSFENKSDLEKNDALDFDDFLKDYFRVQNVVYNHIYRCDNV